MNASVSWVIWLLASTLTFASSIARAENSTLMVWPEPARVGDRIAANVFFSRFCRQEFATHPQMSISQTGNVIRARFFRTSPGAGCSARGARLDFMVGSFPAGNFRLEVELEDFEADRVAKDFEVSPRSTDLDSGPSIDFSGLWWDPEESGWALTLHHYQGGTVWASFLTFDRLGAPLWVMTLPGTWRNGFYRAPLVEVLNGPDVLSASSVAPPSSVADSEVVGELQLFLGGDPANPTVVPFRGRMPLEAVLRYTYRGASHERFLRRFELP